MQAQTYTRAGIGPGHEGDLHYVKTPRRPKDVKPAILLATRSASRQSVPNRALARGNRV